MTPGDVAIESSDAMFPQLRNGLAHEFCPMISDWSVEGTSSTLVVTGGAALRYDFQPLGLGTRNGGNGVGAIGGIQTSGTEQLMGAAFSSFGGGHMYGVSQRLDDLVPPMTIMTLTFVRDVSGNGVIFTTSGRGSPKAGGRRFGFYINLYHTNKVIQIRAHNGVETLANQGTGKDFSGINQYASNDFLNIIARSMKEPLDTDDDLDMWLNGASFGLISSSLNLSKTNSPNKLHYIGGDANNEYSADMDIGLVLCWDRYLTDAECDILSGDPLALYRKHALAEMMTEDGGLLTLLDATGAKVVFTGGALVTSKRVLTS